MKRLIASSLTVCLASLALASAPALAQPAIKKTELVTRDGTSVDQMRLRGGVYSTWVIDNQNILYRDDRQDYYLVTLREACRSIEIRSRPFSFHPADPWLLRTSYSYEVRPSVGSPCDVSRIEHVDPDKAKPLRDSAMWRVW